MDKIKDFNNNILLFVLPVKIDLVEEKFNFLKDFNIYEDKW